VDARSRAQIRGEIVRIQRAVGVTTVYVTHDQTEALVLGDRVAVIRNGMIEQTSAPKDLYRRPDNLFVAGFVGSPPMNLAEATVEGADDGLHLRFGGHRIGVTPTSAGSAQVLKSYAWRQVVIGIRPEELSEASASGVGPGSRMRVKVDRKETVGPDVNVYFTMDAPLVLTEDPSRADEKSGEPLLQSQNEWMARLGTSSVESGDEIELGVKPGGFHLFDPRTGELVGP
jgi:multiple sugar transport system ATP-binding protein